MNIDNKGIQVRLTMIENKMDKNAEGVDQILELLHGGGIVARDGLRDDIEKNTEFRQRAEWAIQNIRWLYGLSSGAFIAAAMTFVRMLSQ